MLLPAVESLHALCLLSAAETASEAAGAPPPRDAVASQEGTASSLPANIPSEVVRAVRQMVLDDPSLSAKKIYPAVKVLLEENGEDVTLKDVRAMLAAIESGEDLREEEARATRGSAGVVAEGSAKGAAEASAEGAAEGAAPLGAREALMARRD